MLQCMFSLPPSNSYHLWPLNVSGQLYPQEEDSEDDNDEEKPSILKVAFAGS